jgi:hypothetical protein
MNKEILLSDAISKGFGKLINNIPNQIDIDINKQNNKLMQNHINLDDLLRIFLETYALNNNGEYFDCNANNKESLQIINAFFPILISFVLGLDSNSKHEKKDSAGIIHDFNFKGK